MNMSENMWENIKNILDKCSLNIDDDELKCGMCKHIIIEPTQGLCGCIYCRQCIHNYMINGGRTCPGNISDDCRSISLRNMDDVHLEIDANKRVLSLIVKCPTECCVFEATLYEMVTHWPQCTEKNSTSLTVNGITQCKNKKQNCDFDKNEIIEDLKITIKALKRKNKKLDKTVEELQEKMKNLEYNNSKYNHELLFNMFYELEERLEEQKYEPYLWIVNDFSEHKKDNDCLYSEPFFAFKGGYKMRILMYPNGGYSDDYVSVYFEILNGDFDTLLKWPFCYNVTFTLLSQLGRDHHSQTVYYWQHKCRGYVYKRPLEFGNVGLGFSEFIKYSQLVDASFLINDDSISLMCSITQSQTSLAWKD